MGRKNTRTGGEALAWTDMTAVQKSLRGHFGMPALK
jgi:hypothetical protein